MVKLFDDGFNFYFIDTPGLNDADGDLENIQQIKKIKNKRIINTFILVRDYNNKRLSNSYVKMLKEFIDIFPSENFFEHIILVETSYFKKIEKDSLIDSIKANNDLVEFLNNKKIIIPDKIKTYSMNLESNDNDNEKFFNEILNDIKDMLHLYKSYKVNEKVDINPITGIFNNECLYLHYTIIKTIDFVDFDGESHSETIIVDESKYAMNSISPEQIIVERNKTNETRCKTWWFCKKEYHICYDEIKKYIIKGRSFDLRTKIEETWEDDDEKGEEYRIKLEKRLNENIQVKSL